MTKKKRTHRDFNEYLNDTLQDRSLALNYLNEALADEDERVFLLALKDVIEAQGGDISSLARESNLNTNHKNLL